MRIALDLDGVTYAWEKTARYMLRRKLTLERRPIPTELFAPSTHWDYIKGVIDPEDWRWLWAEAIDEGLYRYGHCEKGAIEGVEALSTLGELVVVTARPHRAFQDTHDWVAFMLNRAKIDALYFSPTKHEVEADVFIDDAPHHARELCGMGKRVLLFDQPWNQEHANHDLQRRVQGWPSVVQAVREM